MLNPNREINQQPTSRWLLRFVALVEFTRYFDTEDEARRYVAGLKYPPAYYDIIPIR